MRQEPPKLKTHQVELVATTRMHVTLHAAPQRVKSAPAIGSRACTARKKRCH